MLFLTSAMSNTDWISLNGNQCGLWACCSTSGGAGVAANSCKQIVSISTSGWSDLAKGQKRHMQAAAAFLLFGFIVALVAMILTAIAASKDWRQRGLAIGALAVNACASVIVWFAMYIQGGSPNYSGQRGNLGPKQAYDAGALLLIAAVLCASARAALLKEDPSAANEQKGDGDGAAAAGGGASAGAASAAVPVQRQAAPPVNPAYSASPAVANAGGMPTGAQPMYGGAAQQAAYQP